jgi:hypothetical protein
MATQGLITVQSGGHVLMKIVAGCNGYNAPKLAEEIKKRWPLSTKDAYKLAFSMNFGCPPCLVAFTESEVAFVEDEELDPLYRETFQEPRFNPRWKQGIADYIEIINV